MELGIPKATPLGVTQQANTGYAAVLDQSSFDPIRFLENMNRDMEAKETAKAKQQLERKAKWNNYKLPDVTELNYVNQEEISKAIDEITNIAAQAAADGLDPDSPEFLKTINPYNQKIAKAKQEGDKLYQFAEDLWANQAEYDPEEVEKWYEGLKAQPSMAAMIEYKNKTPLPQKPFDIQDAIIKLMPAEDFKEVMIGDGVTKGITKLNRDKVKKFVEGQFKKFNLDPTTQDDMVRTYKAGEDKGYWKNADEFLDYMTDEVMAQGVNKEEYQGYNSSSFEGSGAGGGDFNIKPIYDNNFVSTSKEPLTPEQKTELATLQAKYDTAVRLQKENEKRQDKDKVAIDYLTQDDNNRLIELKKTQNATPSGTSAPIKAIDVTAKAGDVSPITVISDDKKDVPFVPLRYIKVKGDDGSEFWRVEGKEGSSKAIVKTEELGLYEGMDTEIKNLGGGRYEVTVLSPRSISIPLTDANKVRLNSYLKFDFDKYVASQEKNAPKPTSGGGNAPSVSLNDYRAMSLSERQAYLAKGGKVPTK